MSSISSDFRLTWSIESFHKDALYDYISLESGFCKIESLKNTRWNLRLFREGIGKDDWIMCDLKNGCGFLESETVYLNFCLYIKVRDEKYFKRVGYFIESLPASFYRTPFMLTSSLRDEHCPNHTLTVVCEIRPYREYRNADDLERLSNDASMLYLHKPYTDLKLFTDDHQVFKAHKFVLCSRWCESNSWLNETRNEMKVKGVSGPVFENFLWYLYSGKLSGIRMSPELIEFASEKCKDLMHNMRTLSNELSMRTPMHTQRSVLKLSGKDYPSVICALPFHQVIPLHHHLYTPELMVNVYREVNNDTGEEYLDISFWFTDFEPVHPVFLLCHVSLLGGPVRDMSDLHVFYVDDEWHFPQRIKTDGLAQLSSFQLVLTLDIGDFHSPPFVKTTRTEFRTESRDVNNLPAMARNFKAIVKEPRYEDLIVQTERNAIYLHRAMLIVRSNLFRKILERSGASKDIQTINISPVDFKLMTHFVEYIYCGSLKYLSIDEVHRLLCLSEVFHMPNLEDFCQTFIDYYHSKRSQMWY